MKKAFISYRRSDSPGYVRALYDRLVQHFDSRHVFMDVDDIQLGFDFVTVLDKNLKDCAVMLVVMGEGWLNARNSSGDRRLDNPADFVRLEISRALERGIPVIPILVNHAQMPSESDLPDNLKALARRQALELNNKNYDYSIQDLVKALEKYLGKPKSRPRNQQAFIKTEQKMPWYYSVPFLVFITLFMFPVGFFLIWKSPRPFKSKAMAGGIAFGIFILMVLIGGEDTDNTTDGDSIDSDQVMVAPPPPNQSSSNTDAAGFDCNAAGTDAEKAICATSEARRADKEMNDAYRKFEEKLPPAERDNMWEQQKIWLQGRDNHIKHTCLNKPTEQAASKCISKFYQEHTDFLSKILNSRFMEMRVFDPPSNIRDKPNGKILCAVPKKEIITIYIIPVEDGNDSWYWTEYCGKGQWGMIHDSQVKPL